MTNKYLTTNKKTQKFRELKNDTSAQKYTKSQTFFAVKNKVNETE